MDSQKVGRRCHLPLDQGADAMAGAGASGDHDRCSGAAARTRAAAPAAVRRSAPQRRGGLGALIRAGASPPRARPRRLTPRALDGAPRRAGSAHAVGGRDDLPRVRARAGCAAAPRMAA